MQIWHPFFILVFLSKIASTETILGLTEKEIFEIEVMDYSKKEDRGKMIEMIFGKNKNKIGFERLRLAVYVIILNEEYEHAIVLKHKQEVGGSLKKEEEDSLVNIFVADHYLQDMTNGRKKFGRKEFEEIVDQEKYLKYLHGNKDEMLRRAKDEVFTHPIALDETDIYEDDDFYDNDL